MVNVSSQMYYRATKFNCGDQFFSFVLSVSFKTWLSLSSTNCLIDVSFNCFFLISTQTNCSCLR
ncbi:unnamed protein product [Coffea canephora]|uniref:Uncharacterized protein n=1 Tax=Coffea canephora TaxID=49390 RepID=A0A068VF54_COFCA|nr:unnamed protein product [Coffea canephora]